MNTSKSLAFRATRAELSGKKSERRLFSCAFTNSRPFTCCPSSVRLSRTESAASGKLHQSRTFAGDCVQLIRRVVQQQVHLGSWGRSSPHASSRLSTHVRTASTVQMKSRPGHEGKPNTQQVHWERCRGTLERKTSLPTSSTLLMWSTTL